MKQLAVCCLLLLALASEAQKNPGNFRKPAPSALSQLPATPQLSRNNLIAIKKMEDSLTQLANIIMLDTVDLNNRKLACYQFIPKLIRALKFDNSFYYPFDSLYNVSRIYPPDSSFRLLTWQLHYPKGHFRYYGILQMKSQKMKIFPLKDLRDTLPFHTQQVLTNENWYGQIYYRIIEKTVNKKTIYTLFGFEAADFISKRKIVDVLTFDEKGSPHFGAPLFQFNYTDSSLLKMKDTLSRFFIEYKWSAMPTLNYDDALNLIVYDHLAPPDKRAKGAYFTYVQDGTYEGFKWTGDHWQWVEKVFTFSIDEDDNPPIPAPLFSTPKKQPVLPGEGGK
ncbi:MAG: hypothetical protein U0T73_06550 [Chitinophagales bacterium]